MAFHNVQLPPSVQYGSIGGPGFATIVQPSASGHEVRVQRQSKARWRMSLMKELQSTAEAAALKSFAIERRGSMHSFRLKDNCDFTSASDGVSAVTNLDQVLGSGDGTETQFQVAKTYNNSGLAPYVRTITLPCTGTVVIAIDGTAQPSGWTLGSDGIITFAGAPTLGQVVTAGFQFDVPCRFATSVDEWLRLRLDSFGVWSLQGLDAIETLSEVENPERWYPGGGRDWGALAQDVTLAWNDGMAHAMAPSSAINVALPSTERMPGGPFVVLVANKSGSAGTIQVRDYLGNAVGGTIASGNSKRFGLVRSASTITWIAY